jgi:hypothetical protein
MQLTFTTFTVLLVVILGTSALDAESLSGGGAWQSNSGGSIKGAWSANLERTGNAVSGEFAVEGSPLFSGGSANGAVSGEDVVIGVITSGTTEATFTGKLKEGSVSGTWELPAINDTGTWEGSLE